MNFGICHRNIRGIVIHKRRPRPILLSFIIHFLQVTSQISWLLCQTHHLIDLLVFSTKFQIDCTIPSYFIERQAPVIRPQSSRKFRYLIGTLGNSRSDYPLNWTVILRLISGCFYDSVVSVMFWADLNKLIWISIHIYSFYFLIKINN